LLPTAALLFGWLWSRLPVRRRAWLPPGAEWIMVIPVAAAAIWAGWSLGPVVENLVFFVRDAEGHKIADFRLWWPEFTGTSFSQRNSMVLGFMMGFSVIPIIFTIAEDALSNVPPSLLAASQALGASRWQAARTVMIPVAAAGIFSALMIGFGRAVGETMIVVMASGNTPIAEWNIFSGMRTLSANIAVELPEAPVGSTHYRALFLGALLLFLLTFVVNTVAELLRQRLREKFKLV
jgi:phosphate transport system permease protein